MFFSGSFIDPKVRQKGYRMKIARERINKYIREETLRKQREQQIAYERKQQEEMEAQKFEELEKRRKKEELVRKRLEEEVSAAEYARNYVEVISNQKAEKHLELVEEEIKKKNKELRRKQVKEKETIRSKKVVRKYQKSVSVPGIHDAFLEAVKPKDVGVTDTAFPPRGVGRVPIDFTRTHFHSLSTVGAGENEGSDTGKWKGTENDEEWERRERIGMAGRHWTEQEQQRRRDIKYVPQQHESAAEYSAELAEKHLNELASEEEAEALRWARGLEAERRLRDMERMKEAEIILNQVEQKKAVEEKKRAIWIGEERGREVGKRKHKEQGGMKIRHQQITKMKGQEEWKPESSEENDEDEESEKEMLTDEMLKADIKYLESMNDLFHGGRQLQREKEAEAEFEKMLDELAETEERNFGDENDENEEKDVQKNEEGKDDLSRMSPPLHLTPSHSSRLGENTSQFLSLIEPEPLPPVESPPQAPEPTFQQPKLNEHPTDSALSVTPSSSSISTSKKENIQDSQPASLSNNHLTPLLFISPPRHRTCTPSPHHQQVAQQNSFDVPSQDFTSQSPKWNKKKTEANDNVGQQMQLNTPKKQNLSSKKPNGIERKDSNQSGNSSALPFHRTPFNVEATPSISTTSRSTSIHSLSPLSSTRTTFSSVDCESNISVEIPEPVSVHSISQPLFIDEKTTAEMPKVQQSPLNLPQKRSPKKSAVKEIRFGVAQKYAKDSVSAEEKTTNNDIPQIDDLQQNLRGEMNLSRNLSEKAVVVQSPPSFTLQAHQNSSEGEDLLDLQSIQQKPLQNSQKTSDLEEETRLLHQQLLSLLTPNQIENSPEQTSGSSSNNSQLPPNEGTEAVKDADSLSPPTSDESPMISHKATHSRDKHRHPQHRQKQLSTSTEQQQNSQKGGTFNEKTVDRAEKSSSNNQQFLSQPLGSSQFYANSNGPFSSTSFSSSIFSSQQPEELSSSSSSYSSSYSEYFSPQENRINLLNPSSKVQNTNSASKFVTSSLPSTSSSVAASRDSSHSDQSSSIDYTSSVASSSLSSVPSHSADASSSFYSSYSSSLSAFAPSVSSSQSSSSYSASSSFSSQDPSNIRSSAASSKLPSLSHSIGTDDSATSSSLDPSFSSYSSSSSNLSSSSAFQEQPSLSQSSSDLSSSYSSYDSNSSTRSSSTLSSLSSSSSFSNSSKMSTPRHSLNSTARSSFKAMVASEGKSWRN
ncbi:uncharacterized protein MONOS_444 [Monocercomonoides exilis]|uniref:uncharacterized protein n=1 Tax=Monocercomonoides exilis TaxID=2049356 RepID=UPI00355941B0|nr:hypothetical protein MONOS_444 [Monocercomonoides exilis]|eukprot:MONOS_444.1-p1 / transcript=MONOS_444.1 / gene=MONOS_444 / organism=Monocercomonoides_exilis_PA203 / gene_product=unspecified product / transcript_product=unspecified product / location=Mono_scaffold00007:105300-109281(-) / protein_length=1212 / sequence_SO=supercontig / SO=protein_coding / is_pseudo=false